MDSDFLTANENTEAMSWLYELENTDLSHYMDERELEILLKHSKTTTFVAGELILQQGKKSEGIYILLNGTVLVNARLMGQGFTPIESLSAGHFLGEISFIEKGPCSTSYVAQDKVQCLFITSAYFDMLATYFPETKYKLLRAICKQICGRLKRMHDKVTSIITQSNMASLSFYGRVVQTLNQPKQITFEEHGINCDFLKNKALFQAFSKEELSELAEHSLLLEAPKNCKLIYEGESTASCYIVVHGAVQSCIMKDNKLAKLSVIGPATLFSSIACINEDPASTVSFISCEQSILLKLSEEKLKFIENNNPTLWYKLFDLICGSLVALQKSIDKLDVRLHIEAYNR